MLAQALALSAVPDEAPSAVQPAPVPSPASALAPAPTPAPSAVPAFRPRRPGIPRQYLPNDGFYYGSDDGSELGAPEPAASARPTVGSGPGIWMRSKTRIWFQRSKKARLADQNYEPATTPSSADPPRPEHMVNAAVSVDRGVVIRAGSGAGSLDSDHQMAMGQPGPTDRGYAASGWAASVVAAPSDVLTGYVTSADMETSSGLRATRVLPCLAFPWRSQLSIPAPGRRGVHAGGATLQRR